MSGCRSGCKPGGACRWDGCANLCPGCPTGFGFQFHRYPCSLAGTVEVLATPTPVVARPAPQTEGDRDHETD